MKKMMGIAQPKSMVQQLTTFFSEKVAEVEVEQAPALDQQRKIKACSVCKVQKTNHIVREFANSNQSSNESMDTSLIGGGGGENNEKSGSHADQIREQFLKLTKREVIEQVVFDPQHGIVKREIHFGIIDYLTVSYL